MSLYDSILSPYYDLSNNLMNSVCVCVCVFLLQKTGPARMIRPGNLRP